jgi:hypothetical protein
MRQFYAEHEWDEYAKQTTAAGFLAGVAEKLYLARTSTVRPWVIWVPLIVGLLLIRRNRAARWAAIVCVGLLVIQLTCTPWFRQQYLAPAMGFYFLLATAGLRALAMLRWRAWRIGAAAAAIVVGWLLIGGIAWAVGYVHSPPSPFVLYRAELVRELMQVPGRKSLVIVRYSPTHSPLGEIVYNGADLDASDVIFARDMGQQENRKLLEYYPDRRAMLLDLDTAQLTPLERTR